uniref:Uncharacterized protein n=1 Tax=Anguilla anguilla TaxID=7936 RepID=A0A0E9THF3_ANGAN
MTLHEIVKTLLHFPFWEVKNLWFFGPV